MERKTDVGRPYVKWAVIGIVLGFVLSGLFYVIWGAFQAVGFVLWSIVGGGGGALAGGRLGGSTLWAVTGAIAVRVLIFVLFGEVPG